MSTNNVNAPKGPALLAKAGVSLADAKWLYSLGKGMPALTVYDDPRFASIKQKVRDFLQKQTSIVNAQQSLA